MSKWISVHERLPKPLKQAIIFNKYGDMTIGTYTEWGWITPDYFREITHWMPLPTPPKEV